MPNKAPLVNKRPDMELLRWRHRIWEILKQNHPSFSFPVDVASLIQNSGVVYREESEGMDEKILGFSHAYKDFYFIVVNKSFSSAVKRATGAYMFAKYLLLGEVQTIVDNDISGVFYNEDHLKAMAIASFILLPNAETKAKHGIEFLCQCYDVPEELVSFWYKLNFEEEGVVCNFS